MAATCGDPVRKKKRKFREPPLDFCGPSYMGDDRYENPSGPMQKLIDIEESQIWRGAIFRVRGSYPYEETVDFMVVETTDEERPLGIMVATGYSAGHTFVHLPPEALVLRTASISVAWLKVNWSKWVYPDCPVEDVLFMERYVL
jgi:hypothetical protein